MLIGEGEKSGHCASCQKKRHSGDYRSDPECTLRQRVGDLALFQESHRHHRNDDPEIRINLELQLAIASKHGQDEIEKGTLLDVGEKGPVEPSGKPSGRLWRPRRVSPL